MRKSLPPEDRKAIQDAVAAVKSGQTIRAAYIGSGTSRFILTKALEANNVPISDGRKGKQIAPDAIAEAVRRLRQDEPFQKIAKDLGLPIANLRNQVVAATGDAVTALRSGRPSNTKAERAAALVRDGKTLQVAADAVGVSRQMVSVWMKREGIQPARERRMQETSLTLGDLVSGCTLSATEIAKQLHIDRVTVVNAAKRAHVALPKTVPRPPFHPARPSAIKDLLGGMRCPQIATKYGVMLNTARKWAAEAGVATGWHPVCTQQQLDYIVAQAADKSAIQLAQELNLPTQTMMKEARAVGGDHLFRKKVVSH